MSLHGPIYQRISQKLTTALRPAVLTIIDETHLHSTHAQSPKRPETHFNLHIVSSYFEGLSLLQRQRKVYQILAEELDSHIHALSMRTKTPSEVSTHPSDQPAKVDPAL